jgi:hypothetical protein
MVNLGDVIINATAALQSVPTGYDDVVDQAEDAPKTTASRTASSSPHPTRGKSSDHALRLIPLAASFSLPASDDCLKRAAADCEQFASECLFRRLAAKSFCSLPPIGGSWPKRPRPIGLPRKLANQPNPYVKAPRARSVGAGGPSLAAGRSARQISVHYERDRDPSLGPGAHPLRRDGRPAAAMVHVGGTGRPPTQSSSQSR